MHDEMDKFIASQLKNWAAEYPVPENGRRRLLRAAAISTMEDYWQPDEDGPLLRRLFPIGMPFAFHDERLPVSVAHSQAWSFDLATLFRQAI